MKKKLKKRVKKLEEKVKKLWKFSPVSITKEDFDRMCGINADKE